MAAESLEVRMARLEGGYDQIDKRLAGIEAGLRDLRGEIRELRGEVRQQFHWVIGLIVVALMVPIALRFLPS